MEPFRSLNLRRSPKHTEAPLKEPVEGPLKDPSKDRLKHPVVQALLHPRLRILAQIPAKPWVRTLRVAWVWGSVFRVLVHLHAVLVQDSSG